MSQPPLPFNPNTDFYPVDDPDLGNWDPIEFELSIIQATAMLDDISDDSSVYPSAWPNAPA